MSGAGPAGTDPESIRGQVHTLNESVYRQFEKVDKRYMQLCELQERDKQQWIDTVHGVEDDDHVQLLRANA